MLKKKNKIIIIFLFSIISSIPLFFNKNLLMSDDILFHISRIHGVFDNIKIGKIIPVYYNYLNNFGYANGLFYPDLFLYVPALLIKLGLNINISTKIFIYLINLSSLISMYICVKTITKNEKRSLLAIFLYSMSFYKVVCIFQRGALGEALGFIFIPLIILGLYEIFYDDEKKGFFLVIGLFGLISSHLITSYILVLMIIIFTIINIKKLKEKQRTKSLIFNITFSILITSYFWLPLIEQLLSQEFNLESNINIYSNITPLYLLITDIPITLKEWFPAGIGIIYYLFIILNYKKLKQDKFIKTLITIVIILLALTSLEILWKIPIIYKTLKIIQFPWRTYTLLTSVAIIIFSIKCEKNKYLKISKKYIVIVYLLNCFILFFNNPIKEQINNYNIMLGEYLPKEVVKNNSINNYNNKLKYHFENNILKIEIKKEQNIELPLIYYKGYKACGKENCYDIHKTENGLIGINNLEKKDIITVYYQGTKIYKISKYTSIIGIITYIFINMEKKYLLKKNNML